MSKEVQSPKPKLIWLNVIVFTLTTLIAVIGVPWYGLTHGFTTAHWVWTILATGFCGISITAGYHRLWSHKTYDAHPIVRFIFAIGGAFAVQNSALHWSSDHRVHHRFVDDNEKDPYSAKRGFWYSHIGWMLREYQVHRYGDYSNAKDLQRDPIVMWQHRNYLWLTLAVNFGIPIALGLIYDDVWGFLLTVGVLRLVVSHHVTFLINSLAHYWGKQPYTDENTARDNGVIALLTYGEGYHNFHHLFQNDYRNGIRWWHYDPTKWLIKTLSWLKLAYNLKTSDEVKIEQARARMQLKYATDNLLHLPHADELIAKLKDEYESYCTQLADYYRLRREWLLAQRKQLIENCEHHELYQQMLRLKQAVMQHKKQWIQINRQLKLHYNA
jgi:stearoyl-CoA desaturase (delta-9 desaturase)